jgi:branched-chain amino acid transport system permease protein
MDLLMNIATKTMLYIVFLLSLNSLMIGKTNLWAIGNIVFFSVGCFFTGFFSANFDNANALYLMFLVVPVVVALLSLVFFYASRVFKADFFMFFSLFFIELNSVINKLVAGSSGFSNIVRPWGLSTDLGLMLVVILFMLLVIYGIYRFDRSRVAKLHAIIRNNDLLATSWGININKTQMPIFVASAVLSGLVGVLFAFCTFGADPNAFTTNSIVVMFALVVFCGIDSIKGSVVAGMIYVLFTFLLESALFKVYPLAAPKIAQIIFGLLLVVSPIIMPKGLFGKRDFK